MYIQFDENTSTSDGMVRGKNVPEKWSSGKKALEKLFSVKGMPGNLNDSLERLRYI